MSNIQPWQRPPLPTKTEPIPIHKRPETSGVALFCTVLVLALLVFNREPKPSSEELEVSINIPDSLDVAEKTVEPLVEEVIPIAKASIAPVKERMTAPKKVVTLQKPKEKKVFKKTIEVLSAGKPNFLLLPESARPAAFIRYALPFAKKIEKDYGIPVSISLGQAILESGSGTNKLSQFHNYFAMKCFGRRCKKGHCLEHPDDKKNDRFYRYQTAQAAFTAYAELLSGRRYGSLKNYKDDYKRWAYGLKRRGYATAKHYPQSLIATIERYNLDQY